MQTIYALRDCYIDYLVSGPQSTGHVVFKLNTFELDRDTFKLAQEQALLKLTEDRLQSEYIDQLVIRPLKASIELAESDIVAATEEVAAFQARFDVGEGTKTDLLLAEARLDDRKLLHEKAKLELAQRRLDLEVMHRKFQAEQTDLQQRIELNRRIREIHQFSIRSSGLVESHSYAGAFIEEGDAICTITLETLAISPTDTIPDLRAGV